MEEIEQAEERLDNIQAVKPILEGLRTISLGSWQAALKKRSAVAPYAERLRTVLRWLLPHLPDPDVERGLRAFLARRIPPVGEPEGVKPAHSVALVVGSERGLVGRFNVAVVDRAERYLTQRRAAGASVELNALGSRIQRILERRQHSLAWTTSLTVTALPPFSLTVELAQRWLERYQAGDLDGVDLIYNSYQGMGSYQTRVTRVIPPQLPSAAERGERAEVWPPPVLEADALGLYGRVVEQWTMTRLYELLLDSAAAEQSTRYQLMESATQNVDRLISELTLAVQAARRRQITREMQELAAGAGLVGPREGRSEDERASG